ncbi:type II toxin-antitoxin system HicA family toxin [Desulfovibrio oxamicus]|uniref:Type II toxin-antitoxin system HicA family toxin n=1 Tax=Nitratidesulfovibrio oxamicus TaxID=32016 RepID=A0ABS0J153_9BACT|nr:type II toxin-antitoxin system HicA family toxin [Nitratidesulfovibrio oxamicus]MBG3876139.1 type II toxin-antitoxin system HicA family toxin [Nitratidesulfovibrio oxamicus]
MKRSDILRQLKKAGLVIVEGGNHTKVYTAQGVFVTTVPRHSEINDFLAKKIAKQAGIQFA